MSSQAGNDVGQNTVMCYFPWLPYYLRYQIGFDVILNDPPANSNASAAGQPQRVIHVQLYFPDGFFCNPAYFGETPYPHSYMGDASHFYPPQPYFYPGMYSGFPYYDPYAAMGYQGPMMWQDPQYVRVVASVVNGQAGEFMDIDGTPYPVIPDCNPVHNQPPENVDSQRPHKTAGHSQNQPSTSGIAGRKNTECTPPRKAKKPVGTKRIPARKGTSAASSRTDGESSATGRKKNLHKEEKLSHHMEEEIELWADEDTKIIECKSITVSSDDDMPSVTTDTGIKIILDMGRKKNAKNVPKKDHKPMTDSHLDSDN